MRDSLDCGVHVIVHRFSHIPPHLERLITGIACSLLHAPYPKATKANAASYSDDLGRAAEVGINTRRCSACLCALQSYFCRFVYRRARLGLKGCTRLGGCSCTSSRSKLI